MDILYEKLTPRICSRIISAIIALTVTFAGFKGYELIKIKKNTEGGTDAKGEGGGETVEVGTAPEENKGNSEKVFSEENAVTVSGEINAEAVIICNMSGLQIIAEKEKKKVISCGELAVFATALLTSRAIDSGRISETEYAVCPANAQKKPNYSASSGVFSVGEKMTVKDILRCMLYQRGSSYAYTLAVHISGSEESFVSELNTLSAELKMTETAFTNVCGLDDGVAKTTAYDMAILMKHFLSDGRLKGLFSSMERLTVGEGFGSVYLTVANDFFVSSCTESQAKADGILGGKIGIHVSGGWSAVLFSRGESEYLVITLGSPSPYSETLKLCASYL